MYSIIVVEDEEIIRKGLISSIDFSGLNCVLVGEAKNGVEGKELIIKLQPDIVITDINMPMMSGIDMIEQTLDVNYTAIIISGYSEFEYAKKAIRFGVSDYVLKPVDEEELEAVLLQAIEQRKLLKSFTKIKQDQGKIRDIDLLNSIQYHDDLVSQMVKFVEQQFQNKITMEDVCKALNYSESLLSKRFKQEVHITFNEYLNRYRVQKAIEYLKDKTRALNEISDCCGFNEYKYFSVVFKKYTNCSPKQFRKMLEG